MNSRASSRGMPARRRQPEVAHAVGQPEVHHLGHRALGRRDGRGCLLEHARGGLAVDVGVPLEGLPQVHVARDVGQDAQLDLAVVGGQQHEVVPARHEGAAGCAGRARCGWGCSGGSGRSMRAGRSMPPPAGTSCAAGPSPGRAAAAGPRRTWSAASCRGASRGASGPSGGPSRSSSSTLRVRREAGLRALARGAGSSS